MISSSELRIGNKIFNQFEESEEVIVVTADIIKELADYEENPNDEQWSRGAPCNYYSKIPLNEEWLLRAGFERKGSHYFEMPDNNQIIEIQEVTSNLGTTYHLVTKRKVEPRTAIGNAIKYVHRLQNLFFEIHDAELEFKTPLL